MEVKFSTEYVKLLLKSSDITPKFITSTADMGTQVIILGHNNSEKIGLNISCLHKTATGDMGVFFGCVRGKSVASGKTLVHSGMIYVIEGDIVLLSQAALKDLGVIPQNFPTISKFGGVEQVGDGSDNLQVDSNLNVKYSAVENAEIRDTLEILVMN